MRKLILGFTLASSVLAGLPALAQTPPPPRADRMMPPPARDRDGPRGFMRADLNGDGIVTRDEARRAADQLFAARDRNRDGRLTPDELGPRAARHDEASAAGRPKRDVTRAQFERKALRRFDRMDANQDGQVAKAEFRQFRLERKQQRSEGNAQG